LTLLLDNSFQNLLAKLAMFRVGRQKHHAYAILSRARKINPNLATLLRKELVWDLKSNSSSISRLWIAPTGSSMPQVGQHFECLAHNVVGACPIHVGDETNATTIFLKLRIVKTLLGRILRRTHGHPSSSWSDFKWVNITHGA
jgi:hypothetical protein